MVRKWTALLVVALLGVATPSWPQTPDNATEVLPENWSRRRERKSGKMGG